ncbi:MAG TPA: tyrosine-type recombinase/integrase, partial [Streptosporangiaceae bacterium]
SRPAGPNRSRFCFARGGGCPVSSTGGGPTGRPVHPDWFSDEFARLARQAGVPSIRLHDGRHSCLSLLEKQGVPISIISKWAGHYDPSFTYSVYVHAEQEDLSSAAATLGKLYKIN